MGKNTSLLLVVALVTSLIFYSCQKSIDRQADVNEIATAANTSRGNGVVPYKFERINEHNFSSQGWREQQGNVVNGVTVFSDISPNVEIVCGPENNSDPRLIQGSVTMNLPTSADPTLRRVRLRRGGYSGTLLADITELKYSTYLIQNCPTNMVLQIDVNGDDARDFNIFFEPRQPWAGPGIPTVILNTWQQWNTLQGNWYPEVSNISGLPEKFTIPQLVALYPNARIFETPNAEAVRFTIGGTPRSLFDNTIGYFDALIIGTKNEQHSTLFDFTCDNSGDQ